MRLRALVLASLLALAPVTASAINDQYAVSGDAPAQPVQAFDDGQWLYVQLRDPMTPPAPIGPNGPVQYQMRGPYLVLPLMDRVELRLGRYRAQVVRAGHMAADGIVSMTSPVGLNLHSPAPVRRQAHVAAPQPAPAAGGLMAESVSGEIVANGSRGAARSSVGTGHGSAGMLTAAAAASPEAYSSFGTTLKLVSDGTAAGAQSVLTARAACEKSGRTCSVEYRGAPAGQITVAEKN